MNHFGRELVMHHGFSALVDGDVILRHRAVASEDEDHLEPGKGTHEFAVLLAKAGEVFCGDEREVHARLEDEAFLFRTIEARVTTSTPARSANGSCTRCVPCLARFGQPRLHRLEPRQPFTFSGNCSAW